MFKKGDVVEVIGDLFPWGLKIGERYPILIDNQFAYLDYPYPLNRPNGFLADGFKIIPPILDTYKTLYVEAQRLKIPYRSTMRKEALRAAIIAQGGVVAAAPLKPIVKPPKPLLEAELRRKVGNYPGVCSYAYEKKDGRQIFRNSDICHARLRGVGGNKLALDVAGHRANAPDKDLYDEFVMYMMNESPCADRFLTKTLEEAYASAILMDVDKGYNSVCTSAIMLRTGSENENKLPTWKWFKNQGFSNNVSWFMANGFDVDGENISIKALSGWHETFVASQDVDDVIKFFKQGFHTYDDVSFRNNNKSYEIWKSIAKLRTGVSLYNFFNKISKTTTGEGWDMREKITKKSLLDFTNNVVKLLAG